MTCSVKLLRGVHTHTVISASEMLLMLNWQYGEVDCKTQLLAHHWIEGDE